MLTLYQKEDGDSDTEEVKALKKDPTLPVCELL